MFVYLGAMPWERGPLARGPKARGPKARKRGPLGADCGRAPRTTRPSRPHPRPRRGPGSDALGARASGPHRAEGPQSADKNDTPGSHGARATPPPKARPWERCPGSAGLWPASGRRPARRRQERHARAGHTPARGVALGAMGSPGSAGVPSACPCGGPVARCGRDARAPRDGTRASLADPAPQGNSKLSARRLMGPCREHVRAPVTWERCPGSAGVPSACPCGGPAARCGRDARAPGDGTRASLADPAPQGHSKLSARRLMGPCREQVHGLRQGTSLWPVTRFSPGERESDCASSIRGNPMNLGTRPPA